MDIVEYRGVRGLVAARVIVDTSAAYTTGEVFQLAGVAQITKTTESTQERHWYDNIPAVVISGATTDTITIDASAIPLKNIAEITGQQYVSNGYAYIEGSNSAVREYAIGYITEDTNGNEIFVWRYKGAFAIPDQTNATKDDGTSANGQQLVYTGVTTVHKFEDNNNRPARALSFEATGHTNICTETAFFQNVMDPDAFMVLVPSTNVSPSPEVTG